MGKLNEQSRRWSLLRDKYAIAEMYALKNLSGVLSGEKPRAFARRLFPCHPSSSLLRHTFLQKSVIRICAPIIVACSLLQS